MTDRYVAIVDSDRRQLRLIDEQTHQEQTLTPPNCFINTPGDQVRLGGPWLMVGCGVLDTPGFTYWLYDISRGQWAPFAISAQCPGHCRVVSIGRYWVKVLSNEEVEFYEPDVAYLQNIQTGSFIADPISPGGRIYDDLDSATGSAPLCTPLRYPTYYPSHYPPQAGSLVFYGQFALVTDEQVSAFDQMTILRRCHSELNIRIATTGGAPVTASSGAVMSSPDGATLSGWRLPGLEQFILSPPPETQVGTCGVVPVALTAHTIYASLCGTQPVWAATLPSAASLTRCISPNLRGKTLAAARAAIGAAHCRTGTIVHAYSTRVAVGRVISQKPAPGTVRATGTTVRIVLSRGRRR